MECLELALPKEGCASTSFELIITTNCTKPYLTWEGNASSLKLSAQLLKEFSKARLTAEPYIYPLWIIHCQFLHLWAVSKAIAYTSNVVLSANRWLARSTHAAAGKQARVGSRGCNRKCPVGWRQYLPGIYWEPAHHQMYCSDILGSCVRYLVLYVQFSFWIWWHIGLAFFHECTLLSYATSPSSKQESLNWIYLMSVCSRVFVACMEIAQLQKLTGKSVVRLYHAFFNLIEYAAKRW